MNDPEEDAFLLIEALCKESPNLLVAVRGQQDYNRSMNRLFNGIHLNKPLACVTPKTTDEVCHVLQYASANHIQVSVLGGGHDPKGK